MTTLGKIRVYKCSHCSTSFQDAGFGSGNTFGAIFFTDGFCVGDMMPDTLSLVKCPSCRQLVSLAKLEVEDESGLYWEGAEKFRDIEMCLDPTLDDYYSFVNSNDLIPDYEPYVRVRIWWLENDKRRNISSGHKEPLSEKERTNLKGLLKFTDESETNDLFVRIELFRELGDFENASRLLQNSTEEKNSKKVKMFRDLIENNDPFVTQFEESGIIVRCARSDKYSQYLYRLFQESREQHSANAYYALGFIYDMGTGVNRDEKTSRDFYTKAAELGNIKAQVLLGGWYYHGKRVKQDFEISQFWLSQAAEAGDPVAQCLLGDIYYFGKVGECDFTEAFKWYTKSAKQGNGESQLNLAHMYTYGECVEINKEIARYWISESSSNDNPNAHYVLAWSHFNGEDGEPDKSLAIQLLCRALEQEKNLYYWGIDSDNTKISDQERLVAVDWFISEANSGNISAMYLLGMLYYYGLLVETSNPSAITWLTKAAFHGNSQAQFFLGKIYEDGKDVEQDKKTAIEWYTKSAEQGNLNAQRCLGMGYFIGGFGKNDKDEDEDQHLQDDLLWDQMLAMAEKGEVEALDNLVMEHFHCSPESTINTEEEKQNLRDEDENQNWQDDVIHWYTMAAELGDAGAQGFLGNFYSTDTLERVDKKKSIDWYVKAAKQGDENAQFILGLLSFNGEITIQDKKLPGEWYIEK